MKKKEFYNILKEVQENIKNFNSQYSGDFFSDEGFDDGCLYSPNGSENEIYGHLMQENESGVGEKYSGKDFIYEYLLSDVAQPIYLKFGYDMSGSPFTDFYYSDFELVEVQKHVEIKEVITYIVEK